MPVKPYVLVIGHACAAGEEPANTLAGVRACLAARAEGMEIDVQLCADGVPVLMHDDTVDRTTNLTGPVRDKTLAELQSADAGNGEPVPTLEQVLQLVAGRLTVMAELKSTPGAPDQDQRCVEAVVEVIRRHKAEAWTAIHSFNPEMVRRARALEPRISGAIITGQVEGEGVDILLAGLLKRHGQAVSVEHHCLDRDFIVKAKRRQVPVWAWTADTPEQWTKILEAGADGIVTNFPNQLRNWLDALPE